MGTKTNPGVYDCLANLGPDEPFFVLRAQDILAAPLVRLWAERAHEEGTSNDKVDEALRCAAAMLAWPIKKVPD